MNFVEAKGKPLPTHTYVIHIMFHHCEYTRHCNQIWFPSSNNLVNLVPKAVEIISHKLYTEIPAHTSMPMDCNPKTVVIIRLVYYSNMYVCNSHSLCPSNERRRYFVTTSLIYHFSSALTIQGLLKNIWLCVYYFNGIMIKELGTTTRH